MPLLETAADDDIGEWAVITVEFCKRARCLYVENFFCKRRHLLGQVSLSLAVSSNTISPYFTRRRTNNGPVD
uniref:Uncharacterized protein n=1 Tax=Timema bartmani TaxID=61472 RepID=A0A7R9I361_9NEOP|nr:unnamed protein product [Timema bartmani]